MEFDENIWKQQFKPYKESYLVFCKYFKQKPLEDYTDLEKIGLIKIFEFILDNCWQLMSEYLTAKGVDFQEKTPREVINTAASAKIIEDGHSWVFMLNIKNVAANTYSMEVINDALKKIMDKYVGYIDRFYNSFLQKYKINLA
jgi:nucleotidyltransferase substrate binding protein (TIGR01987 family)